MVQISLTLSQLNFGFMKEEEEKEIIVLAHNSFIHLLSYMSTKFCFCFGKIRVALKRAGKTGGWVILLLLLVIFFFLIQRTWCFYLGY